MRFIVGLYTAIAIVMLALWWFIETLSHSHLTIIKPIEVRNWRPDSTLSMYIDTHCPHQLGELQKFLDCRADVYRRVGKL